MSTFPILPTIFLFCFFTRSAIVEMSERNSLKCVCQTFLSRKVQIHRSYRLQWYSSLTNPPDILSSHFLQTSIQYLLSSASTFSAQEFQSLKSISRFSWQTINNWGQCKCFSLPTCYLHRFYREACLRATLKFLFAGAYTSLGFQIYSSSHTEDL